MRFDIVFYVLGIICFILTAFMIPFFGVMLLSIAFLIVFLMFGLLFMIFGYSMRPRQNKIVAPRKPLETKTEEKPP